MSQSLVSVAVFLALLACLPMLVKWLKQRSIVLGARESSGQSRFISALAVGPHQRVVTVEVGPEGGRVWLTLGVTAQHISCLHSTPVNASADDGQKSVSQRTLVQP
ncbi:MAG: flagellar biosynthetic protein FliO [Rhodoferax sp.]|nr:flagellar biosynthetic protein FliO [Rhodoferax sp.]